MAAATGFLAGRGTGEAGRELGRSRKEELEQGAVWKRNMKSLTPMVCGSVML